MNNKRIAVKALTVGTPFSFTPGGQVYTVTGITVGAPGEGTRVTMRSYPSTIVSVKVYPSLMDVYPV